jgi:hypothetical protein
MAEIKTQGTELYLLDTDNAVVLKIACIRGLSGIGGQASDIDVTCLDDLKSRRFLTGLIDNGTATFQMAIDPDSPGYARLGQIVAGGNYKWAVGFANGYGIDPTYDAGPPADFELPTGRWWMLFDGGVNQLQRSAEIDSVWMADISIRVSGDILEIF